LAPELSDPIIHKENPSLPASLIQVQYLYSSHPPSRNNSVHTMPASCTVLYNSTHPAWSLCHSPNNQNPPSEPIHPGVLPEHSPVHLPQHYQPYEYSTSIKYQPHLSVPQPLPTPRLTRRKIWARHLPPPPHPPSQ